MARAAADCRRVAPGLSALAASREPIRDLRFVVDHVDRCDRCLATLQDLTLTAFALRRMGELPAEFAPAPTAWPRLRARILRSRARARALAWRWRTTLAGIAASALVVAAVAAPMALHLPLGATGAEPTGYSERELDLLSRQIEARYIAEARNSSLAATSATSSLTMASAAISEGLPRRFPDGIAPVVKEVASRPSGRPPAVH